MYLKDIILKTTTHINICKKGNRKPNGYSTYNLRIPLTIRVFHLEFRIPQFLLFFEQFWAVPWERKHKVLYLSAIMGKNFRIPKKILKKIKMFRMFVKN